MVLDFLVLEAWALVVLMMLIPAMLAVFLAWLINRE